MAPLPLVRSWTSRTAFLQFSAERSPGTTTSRRRCSGSMAVWSQSSPLSSSRGPSGSRFFSFLPMKFHFSSNWTSRVSGGKSHEFVVVKLGLVAGKGEVAGDGVTRDTGEARRGADPVARADMVEDGDDLVGRQLGALEGGALAFGGCFLAGAAVDHADPLVAATPAAEINVAVVPFAVVGAGRIVAEALLDG